MELPANPGKLLHGVYDKMGRNLVQTTTEQKDLELGIHALSAPTESNVYTESEEWDLW